MFKQLPKSLIIGIVITALILIIIYFFTRLPSGGEKTAIEQVTYGSSDKCAACHRRVTPDIVNQFAMSTMAKAGVRCTDCHEVDRSNPAGREHQGFFITTSPTPKQCANCHPAETKQFEQSRHGGPAWVALSGLSEFTPEQQKLIDEIPEVNRARTELLRLLEIHYSILKGHQLPKLHARRAIQ